MPPNEDGEICICGPTVMKGYLNNKEETDNMIRVHEDGKKWLHTGDLGRMDENGIFYFETRLKRMIITSGYNVYPSHIEEVLNTHEYVINSCVVGIPHPYKVEVAKAFIVLKEGYKQNNETLKSIKEHCSTNDTYNYCYEK